MARTRGRESTGRPGKDRRRGHPRARDVYIFAEGEVTEIEYIDLIMKHGVPADPTRRVVHHFPDDSAPSKRRKPLPLVEAAVRTLRDVERTAERSGLSSKSWNWPQVWCLFDRDDHPQIPTALSQARKARVRVAYSHPCFELWRLLHYQNHTSAFGGVCDDAAARLKQRPGFAQTYGKNLHGVSDEQAKHVKPGQVLGRYEKARGFARKLNEQHTAQDPTTWDPYTDVWRLVEEGLGLTRY